MSARNLSSLASRRIVVLGLGYVGSVSAACLARLGHSVVGVDTDPAKVRQINQGHAPFYEPGLEELVRDGVSAGRLSATTNLPDALPDSDIAFICVGTPSEHSGNLSLLQLRRVSEELGRCLKGVARPPVIAVRSTVYPGTCEGVVTPAVGAHPGAAIVSNPEFLREGNAVKDFMEPSLIVIGGQDPEIVHAVATLYAPLEAPVALVSLRAAEMIKYAANAFHAVKVAFANEMGTLAAHNGVSADEVMSTLCQDLRLNLSSAYLKPGFAFGGSCLPKDLRALNYRAARLDLKLPLLESVLPSNEQHLGRAIRSVLDLDSPELAVFGLAFKENTDDLRESPVVALVETLIGKGRSLRVFDPHIQLDQIYGSNREFLLSSIPHIGRLMVRSVAELLDGASHVVITQKPASPYAEAISASGLPVVDLTAVSAR